MKHYFFAFIILVLVSAPGLASAQTRYGRGYDPVSQDGSSATPTEQMQRIRTYRGQSSAMQSAINSLPGIADPVVLMPVLFGISVSDISPNFGDPRDNGTRTHQGEDILAVKGTPIVSPTEAVVLRTVTGVDEGNAVYTANPGGETFVYMHLDHFGEGVSSGTVLSRGSLIGYVGDTGNAAGGPAHLHFEIHNSSGTPTDPFPRLTGEVPLAEKISDLTKILAVNSDPNGLSAFLVTHFRATFTAAQSQNVSLPSQITDALARIPASASVGGGGLPAGDLDLGSSGTAVVGLQSYLIAAAKGPAAVRLKGAGATGNFGPITQAALVEFQATVGITPASGYYGAETRNYVTAHPLSGVVISPVIAPAPAVSGTTQSSANGALIRDLSIGSTGADVRTLQRVLRVQGFPVVPAGSETAYFGTLTQSAVIGFQKARGVIPANGYVGAATRVQLGIVK
jgi:peptidoglycan hydrolase-like protein with peptidoglycan-binding domain